jgi:hypothetical protein
VHPPHEHCCCRPSRGRPILEGNLR